jgi:hypothetical protein
MCYPLELILPSNEGTAALRPWPPNLVLTWEQIDKSAMLPAIFGLPVFTGCHRREPPALLVDRPSLPILLRPPGPATKHKRSQPSKSWGNLDRLPLQMPRQK